MSAESLIGQSVPKLYDVDKAVGRAQFAADLRLPGMLVARVLRSPYAHARIRNIDISRAAQLPGVAAVVTAADTPGRRFGRWIFDRTVFAQDKARHVGEPVAAVAAEDEETAEEALELIQVDYEELPGVFDPVAAMQPAAGLVHPELEQYGPASARRQSQGNVLDRTRLTAGDVQQALARADLVYKQTYRCPAVHQGAIQPHEAVASVDLSGKVTLWSSTKSPFGVRQMVCDSLGLPMSRLRVIAAAVGGDFGGKGTAITEPIVVLLALKARRPVSLALSREEEFTGTYYRAPAVMELEAGAQRDGALLAVRGSYVIDTGAYHDSIGILRGITAQLLGGYRVPNYDLEGIAVYTNNIPRGHVRAPRVPYPVFAIESHLDGIAHHLGLDPVELRLKNALDNGDTIAAGAVLHHSGFKKTLHAVADYLKRQPPVDQPNQAWGVAAGQWGVNPVATAGPPSAAYIKVNEDGTVVLLTGVTDQGAGQHTVLAQMVAEVLGLPVDAVSVVAADTDLTPYDQGTGGSQTTYRAGTATRQAAEDAKRQLLALAAEQLKLPEVDLVMEEGRVHARGAPEVSVSLPALGAASLASRGGPILGNSNAGRKELMDAMAQARGTVDAPIYACHAAQVAVDPETGQVKVLRYFVAQDVGRVLNPRLLEAQVHGGVVFGLGMALSEEVLAREGRVLNPNFLDYRQPVATGIPPIEMVLVEEPSQFGPWGAKGVGEPPTVPVPPAIANAVFRAVGARVTELPITPERIVRALKAKR